MSLVKLNLNPALKIHVLFLPSTVFQVSRMDSSGRIPMNSLWLLELWVFEVSLATS